MGTLKRNPPRSEQPAGMNTTRKTDFLQIHDQLEPLSWRAQAVFALRCAKRVLPFVQVGPGAKPEAIRACRSLRVCVEGMDRWRRGRVSDEVAAGAAREILPLAVELGAASAFLGPNSDLESYLEATSFTSPELAERVTLARSDAILALRGAAAALFTWRRREASLKAAIDAYQGSLRAAETASAYRDGDRDVWEAASRDCIRLLRRHRFAHEDSPVRLGRLWPKGKPAWVRTALDAGPLEIAYDPRGGGRIGRSVLRAVRFTERQPPGRALELHVQRVLSWLSARHPKRVDLEVQPRFELQNGRLVIPDFDLRVEAPSARRLYLIECQDRKRPSLTLLDKIHAVRMKSGRQSFIVIYGETPREQLRDSLTREGVMVFDKEGFEEFVVRLDAELAATEAVPRPPKGLLPDQGQLGSV